MTEVTDADVLARFNAGQPVTDPEVLARFNPIQSPSPLSQELIGGAKQVGSGVIEGAAAVPSLISQAGEQGMALYDPQVAQRLTGYRQKAEDYLNRNLPQPQNEAQTLERSVGAGIGGSLLAPGGIVPNLIGGAVSGLGSYAGAKYGPEYAGVDPETGAVAGSLLGGGVGLRAGEGAINKYRGAALAPSKEILRDTSAGYDQLRTVNQGVPIQPREADLIADSITGQLRRAGPSELKAPGVYKELQKFKTQPNIPNQHDVSDLVGLRQTLKEDYATDLKNPTERVAAIKILPAVDAMIEYKSPGTMARLRELDNNWYAARGSQAVSYKAAKAADVAGTQNSGLNTGAKVQQNVGSYIDQHTDQYGDVHGIKPQDLAVLQRVRQGSIPQNLVRWLTNYEGGGGGLGAQAATIGGGLLGAGGAAALGNDPMTIGAAGGIGAILGPASGLLGRIGLNASIRRQAEEASAAIRARSPYAVARGQAAPSRLPWQWAWGANAPLYSAAPIQKQFGNTQ